MTSQLGTRPRYAAIRGRGGAAPRRRPRSRRRSCDLARRLGALSGASGAAPAPRSTASRRPAGAGRATAPVVNPRRGSRDGGAPPRLPAAAPAHRHPRDRSRAPSPRRGGARQRLTRWCPCSLACPCPRRPRRARLATGRRRSSRSRAAALAGGSGPGACRRRRRSAGLRSRRASRRRARHRAAGPARVCSTREPSARPSPVAERAADADAARVPARGDAGPARRCPPRRRRVAPVHHLVTRETHGRDRRSHRPARVSPLRRAGAPDGLRRPPGRGLTGARAPGPSRVVEARRAGTRPVLAAPRDLRPRSRARGGPARLLGAAAAPRASGAMRSSPTPCPAPSPFHCSSLRGARLWTRSGTPSPARASATAATGCCASTAARSVCATSGGRTAEGYLEFDLERVARSPGRLRRLLGRPARRGAVVGDGRDRRRVGAPRRRRGGLAQGRRPRGPAPPAAGPGCVRAARPLARAASTPDRLAWTLDQAFTVVYRVLFLLFAESRSLVPVWHPVYRRSYTIDALRTMAERPGSQRGLWEGLQALSRLAHAGCRAGSLTVAPFNGRLFAPARAPLAETGRLDDGLVARALVSLTTLAVARPARARVVRRPRRRAARRGLRERARLRARGRDAPRRSPARARRHAPASLVGRGDARKSSGTFYTPRSITGLPRAAHAPARWWTALAPTTSCACACSIRRWAAARCSWPRAGSSPTRTSRRSSASAGCFASRRHRRRSRRVPPPRRAALPVRRRSQPDGGPGGAALDVADDAGAGAAAVVPRSPARRRRQPRRRVARGSVAPAAGRRVRGGRPPRPCPLFDGDETGRRAPRRSCRFATSSTGHPTTRRRPSARRSGCWRGSGRGRRRSRSLRRIADLWCACWFWTTTDPRAAGARRSTRTSRRLIRTGTSSLPARLARPRLDEAQRRRRRAPVPALDARLPGGLLRSGRHAARRAGIRRRARQPALGDDPRGHRHGRRARGAAGESAAQLTRFVRQVGRLHGVRRRPRQPVPVVRRAQRPAPQAAEDGSASCCRGASRRITAVRR